jgi:hypothetical protein
MADIIGHMGLADSGSANICLQHRGSNLSGGDGLTREDPRPGSGLHNYCLPGSTDPRFDEGLADIQVQVRAVHFNDTIGAADAQDGGYALHFYSRGDSWIKLMDDEPHGPGHHLEQSIPPPPLVVHLEHGDVQRSIFCQHQNGFVLEPEFGPGFGQGAKLVLQIEGIFQLGFAKLTLGGRLDLGFSHQSDDLGGRLTFLGLNHRNGDSRTAGYSGPYHQYQERLSVPMHGKTSFYWLAGPLVVNLQEQGVDVAMVSIVGNVAPVIIGVGIHGNECSPGSNRAAQLADYREDVIPLHFMV